jgi:uncharacterized membrane protein
MANTPSSAHPLRHLPMPIRIVRTRPRLFISVMVGLLVFLAVLLTDWRLPTRILIAWDVCIGLYLVLAFHLTARADVHHIRRRARLQDEGQTMLLVLTAVAALASLGAIIALLGTAGGTTRSPIQLVFATVTIVLSWAFTHTMFALHYAHEFYDENGGKGGGMQFPGDDPEPDYWDFSTSPSSSACARRFRRDRELQADPAHGVRPQRHFLHLQCRIAGADGEHRGERAVIYSGMGSARPLKSATFLAVLPSSRGHPDPAPLARRCGSRGARAAPQYRTSIVLVIAGVALALAPASRASSLRRSLSCSSSCRR